MMCHVSIILGCYPLTFGWFFTRILNNHYAMNSGRCLIINDGLETITTVRNLRTWDRWCRLGQMSFCLLRGGSMMIHELLIMQEEESSLSFDCFALMFVRDVICNVFCLCYLLFYEPSWCNISNVVVIGSTALWLVREANTDWCVAALVYS